MDGWNSKSILYECEKNSQSVHLEEVQMFLCNLLRVSSSILSDNTSSLGCWNGEIPDPRSLRFDPGLHTLAELWFFVSSSPRKVPWCTSLAEAITIQLKGVTWVMLIQWCRLMLHYQVVWHCIIISLSDGSASLHFWELESTEWNIADVDIKKDLVEHLCGLRTLSSVLLCLRRQVFPCTS